jgi:hypothetical protein
MARYSDVLFWERTDGRTDDPARECGGRTAPHQRDWHEERESPEVGCCDAPNASTGGLTFAQANDTVRDRTGDRQAASCKCRPRFVRLPRPDPTQTPLAPSRSQGQLLRNGPNAPLYLHHYHNERKGARQSHGPSSSSPRIDRPPGLRLVGLPPVGLAP